jgi:hypothetical protein
MTQKPNATPLLKPIKPAKDLKGALPQFKPEELQPTYYTLSLSPGHLDQPTIPITEVRVDEGVEVLRIRATFGNRDLNKREIAVVLDGKQLDVVDIYFRDVRIEEFDVPFGGATKAIFSALLADHRPKLDMLRCRVAHLHGIELERRKEG